eukprot:m.13293 g.13293  ORF g.13293 m.13293 type:complete len:224 (+) comp8371_c0_seq1:76-747(+)
MIMRVLVLLAFLLCVESTTRMYRVNFEGSTCSGTVEGVRHEYSACVPVTGNPASHYYTCTEDLTQISVKKYTNNDCTGDLDEEVFQEQGCDASANTGLYFTCSVPSSDVIGSYKNFGVMDRRWQNTECSGEYDSVSFANSADCVASELGGSRSLTCGNGNLTQYAWSETDCTGTATVTVTKLDQCIEGDGISGYTQCVGQFSASSCHLLSVSLMLICLLLALV